MIPHIIPMFQTCVMVESQFQVIKLVPHHPRSAMFSTFRSSSSAAVGPDPRSLVMLEDQWMIV